MPAPLSLHCETARSLATHGTTNDCWLHQPWRKHMQVAGDDRQIRSGRVSLVTPARYLPAPGSELTIDYGAKSNEQLLFLYGAPV